MFKAAQFAQTKTQKHPTCPSTEDQPNKKHTAQYQPAIKKTDTTK